MAIPFSDAIMTVGWLTKADPLILHF